MQKDLKKFPGQSAKAGEIYAISLIDEMMHLLIGQYRNDIDQEIIEKAYQFLVEEVGKTSVDEAIKYFATEFPPLEIFLGNTHWEEYISGSSNGIENKFILLEEMLLLWIENNNPAFILYKEFYDDSQLNEETSYLQIIEKLKFFFSLQPKFSNSKLNLFQLLESPAKNSPNSIEGQLSYILDHWKPYLGERVTQLINSLDLLKEESKPRFGGKPGTSEIHEYSHFSSTEDSEGFSEDRDWMSKLVLIAKNTYVWMDQLSKKYAVEIKTLNQIPDAELDILAERGINGLWLIGLWERSRASKRIKQIMGNHDAVASAYSLFDYQIADDLGGEDAMANLRNRAIQRGIKLASDMVPNHMGIDSLWIAEHPDWFISLDESPFPVYSFNGEDLSFSTDHSIFLEDHYYEKTDAAVVFKHVDYVRGETKYIYHGNDGTNMPWNDTAQINFLNREAREAVIQIIINVAKQFPIIRFDAAMTLAKKHIQRLWYPIPGSAGDIPSRAGKGLNEKEFNERIPKEFWREVVDRISVEAPDTLLLAEAFWTMEGYFVRNLGMHRVYNSAFMHMLRDEDNEKFQQSIKNTLKFDPQILKRFVNFMNNPDEETAIEQFGRDDKYFGVCTLLATLPGLPMIGHGQIEGYTEKYGMEYYKAKLSEYEDQELINRHQQQIFPLFHKRNLFAEVDNFLLYDFVTNEGNEDPNVFAFSNQLEDQQALVIYHNRYTEMSGWIKNSAEFKQKSDEEQTSLIRKMIGEGLNLPKDPNAYLIFQDFISKKEFIRNCLEVHKHGLYFDLKAYQTNVYVNFQIVFDNQSQDYSRLTDRLAGRGVESIQKSRMPMILEDSQNPINDTIFPEKLIPDRGNKSLKVLFMASEAMPYIKVGGLGDVAGSLPNAIYSLDAKPDIRLIIPMHGNIDRSKFNLEMIATFSVAYEEKYLTAEVFQLKTKAAPVYFVGGELFDEASSVYLEDGNLDALRYIFFSMASLKFFELLNWKPDLIHANDWHTSPAIYAIKAKSNELFFYKDVKTLVTVHNLPYLGNQVADVFEGFGLSVPDTSDLPDWANSMALPLGMDASDKINTVSQGYAQEIQTTEFGSGLDRYLRENKNKVSGIINGLDLKAWNPNKDKFIKQTFDRKSLTERKINKLQLLSDFSLDLDPRIPLFSIISRLDNQKGIDIALAALRNLTDQSWQTVILGSGDQKIEQAAIALADEFPNRISTIIKYDEKLAHKIYAGADAILIPSRYEPCGLTQMIAMRYGCVPIARATGGLKDTIEDYYSEGRSTGFLFNEATSKACEKSISDAISIFTDQRKWRGLQLRGMQQDFSWKNSANKYLDLYQQIFN
ncbi:MAG: glycosyltransferase [Chloroflexi bacterium]|nr:glycosyltransferase [Chloroflexota bacterium]MBT3669886.1 glycosyltransferase [Chloroflexota bacterium]MBT4534711.1 glycosyltransferase [Chloroflexota bacterium]MBT4755611.1 glycosyltransferase [Chloroflexota bacterium]MBT6152184.1 glycosyltransferase [Chloroflexota bacterium]